MTPISSTLCNKFPTAKSEAKIFTVGMSSEQGLAGHPSLHEDDCSLRSTLLVVNYILTDSLTATSCQQQSREVKYFDHHGTFCWPKQPVLLKTPVHRLR